MRYSVVSAHRISTDSRVWIVLDNFSSTEIELVVCLSIDEAENFAKILNNSDGLKFLVIETD